MKEIKKIAVIFPGQGSQFIGMGKEFLESEPEALRVMEMAESWTELPLKRLCLEGPAEELVRGGNLQPAITTVNLLCWQALCRAGIRPDFVAGHSLGEYSAFVAAGILSPEDAIRLAAKRGAFMEREGKKKAGGMIAIIGATIDEVRSGLDALCAGGTDIAVIANHNAEKQIVIAGDSAMMPIVRQVFIEKGCKAIPLNVSVANHSPLVAGAVPDFEALLAMTSVSAPVIPVVFNVTATVENEPDVIRKIMARQMISMVRWYESLLTLWREGVRIFIEVGPKNVLSGLVKRTFPEESCQIFQVDTPAKILACVKEIN